MVERAQVKDPRVPAGEARIVRARSRSVPDAARRPDRRPGRLVLWCCAISRWSVA